MKQGAWTDIYALAAVIYFSIARKLPPPSVSRMVQDSYEPLAELAAGRYSNTFLRGIDHCLAVKPENRPQSMAEMRDLIGINLRPAEPASAPSASPQAAPDLPFEMGAAQKPVTPASPPAQAAEARPAPISKPPVRQAPRPVAIDDDEQRMNPAPRGKAPLLAGLTLAALAAAGGGWYYLQQQKAAAPQPVTVQSEPTPPALQSPVTPPVFTPASAPEALASPAGTAASQTVETLPEPVRTETRPAEPVRIEEVKPEAAVVTPPKKPARSAEPKPLKPAEPKPAKPARPAQQDAGDKAERDYMKQLNRDLDNLLK